MLRGALPSPEMFGAKGNGSADDTAAFQAWADWLGNNQLAGTAGARVELPPGEFVLTDTVVLNKSSHYFVGKGTGNSPKYAHAPGHATVLRWAGGNDKPMFHVENSRAVGFESIRFEGQQGATGVTAVHLYTGATGHGSNAWFRMADCWVGRYPWSSQGLNVGDFAYGVLADGPNNVHNDRNMIERTTFHTCTEAGVRFSNNQSIWTHLKDSLFNTCGVGLWTASSVQGTNVLFNLNAVDMVASGPAIVLVNGYHSENCGRIADVDRHARLIIRGGRCQLDSISGYEAGITPGVALDAHPSGRQAVDLQDVEFTFNTQDPKPKFVFGPDQATSTVGNFVIRLAGCVGLTPEQLDFAGAIWAQNPESQGLVEFTSRDNASVYAFRNHLRRTPTSLRTLDTSRWDVDSPASTAPTSRVHGKLIAVGGMGVGNSATASTLGAVTRRIEVFDAAGASLGFVPVYDSIT